VNIPESWLRALCNPRLSGRELADKLTMAGVEVEAYEPVGPKFTNVVVGEVLSVDRHPNADKLTVCKVKVGKETVQVVCGAPNVRVGMRVPLAKVGAKLPGGEIRKSSIRGVESEGDKEYLVVGSWLPPTVNVVSHTQSIAFSELLRRLERIESDKLEVK